MSDLRILCMLLVHVFIVQFCISETMYLLRDVCDHPYGVVISSTTTVSYVGCAAICEGEGTCVSALYMPSTKYCVTNRQSSQYIGSCSQLVKYVAILKRPCTGDTDCSAIANSECVDHVCTCLNHYSYSPTEGTCSSSCSTYGSTFRMFDDIGFTGNNDETSTGISLDDCKQECIQETSFTCRTFEYGIKDNDFKCLRSSVTYFTNPQDYDEGNPDSGWVFGQRNCA